MSDDIPSVGSLNILNVAGGDTTLSFNSKNPEEVERAKKIKGNLSVNRDKH